MEKIELEYEKTTEDACTYLNDLRSETASQVSKALSHDTVSKLYISKDRPVSHNTVRQSVKIPSMWRNWTGFDAQNVCGREAPHASNIKDEFEKGNAMSSGIDPTLGQDLWRQLKRVEIPVFNGDKRVYQSWKAAFLACIDRAPATAEYKLLQLRQYLSGEALKVIENLGHSAFAYQAAKDRLERKYGGRRRQIAIYLEELEHFENVRLGNAKDLEQFADILDVAIINLQEADQHHELGIGSLYAKLQRKLPESLLARYHRWVFEGQHNESVLSLRTWVIQEAEFQTIASETVQGMSGYLMSEHTSKKTNSNNHRSFFGGSEASGKISKCKVCDKHHGVWNCDNFKEMNVSQRWDKAKQLYLCYRCLGFNHVGKSCRRSRQCGHNGCEELHHRLLHRDAQKSMKSNAADRPVQSPTEENGATYLSAKSHTRSDLVGLRTVPVILANGNRSITVNALLDDASTKTYINSDVAAELGCKGRTEKVKVNVLNGQVETFETRPVKFEIRSVNGSVKINVAAYTANKVTGDMEVVDWNKYQRKWPHLRDVTFPKATTRPIVDILIGVDCADLHYALEERRDRAGKPIARLTQLGWTCIGNPCSNLTPVLQKKYARTYFVRDVTEIETLNLTLKKFWEVERESTESHVVNIDEQQALKAVKQSCIFENQMYRVAIPWKSNETVMLKNYKMALNRIENTQKILKRCPQEAKAYSEYIEQYVEKGYVSKVSDSEVSNLKWFPPHFPVLRPDKDTKKTRIVFDAAAKFEDVSLNDKMHQGPKLHRDLFDVLLRFKKHPVAVVCDIAEMYLRIGIDHANKPYHRFLWRGMNHNRCPDIYDFDRVVFGENSSPLQAQYVLQQRARENLSAFPLAAENHSLTNSTRERFHPERDIKIGEVVLIITPETTRGNWPLGRILKVYPGQDGRVRVVHIQVGSSTMTRSVTKLCPLELDN
ncbi:uncharacterized protein LOC127878708 [Dreissena polymorpha]|uniref:uncharacterized protein LOC127878708 n=1 Tax=Dreissena polymorpha TaxID=45954 RepID=UPI0022643582|nr:uncharacterized protein LOC127878708 [Dreissena polymorpha]